MLRRGVKWSPERDGWHSRGLSAALRSFVTFFIIVARQLLAMMGPMDSPLVWRSLK
jgi:hypothetical protein